MLKCLYALGGINYKNGVITTCPRQSNQLVFSNETILPSKLFNHKNFKNIRKQLYNDQWPTGCDTCEAMERDNLRSMRLDFLVDETNEFYKSHGNLNPTFVAISFITLDHFEYAFVPTKSSLLEAVE